MKPLTKSQCKSYRFFRDKGFTVKEARRCAKLTYIQLADELSRKLRAQPEKKYKPIMVRVMRERYGEP